jgi:hypothetical protein
MRGDIHQCISYIPPRKYADGSRIRMPETADFLASMQRQLHASPKHKLAISESDKEHGEFKRSADYQYIPSDIRKKINEERAHHVSYRGKILETAVDIHFCVYDVADRARIQGWVNRIEQWLNYALAHKSEGCVRDKLRVVLLMSRAEKRVPRSGSELVDTVHANSAFTYSCANAELNTITIFRKEDWFKTFIHETFHRLGLDFSGREGETLHNSEIAAMFPGVDPTVDFNICESYCETWAQIINHLFATDTISKFQANIRKDTAFATYQMQKFLNIYGHSYDSLIGESADNTSKYRENTSAFSYFVLRTALQWNLDVFIKWCIDKNGSSSSIVFAQDNIKSYVELIRSIHKDPKFLKFARWIHKSFLPIANKRCSRNARSQFRMTMMEHVV